MPVTVAPAVVSGKANISGDVITLTEGTAATIAFQPSPALDILGINTLSASRKALCL